MSRTTTHIDLPAFRQWLVSQGCELEPPVGEWEVLRYRWPLGLLRIIHRNARGRYTIPDSDFDDYALFLTHRRGQLPETLTWPENPAGERCWPTNLGTALGFDIAERNLLDRAFAALQRERDAQAEKVARQEAAVEASRQAPDYSQYEDDEKEPWR